MSKLDALWKYSEAESAYEQLEAQITSTPSRIKFNKIRNFLTEQQTNLARINRDMEAKQAGIERITEQFGQLSHKYELEVSEFSTMENDAECTAAEVSESRREIEALIEQINIVRRELFDMISWIEKAEEESKDMLAKAAKAKKEYDVLRITCEAEMDSFKDRLAEAKAKVDACAKDVDRALLTKYIQLKKNYEMPLAKLENNQCGGCNMSLPTVVTKRVANEDAIVECENCGRILYL